MVFLASFQLLYCRECLFFIGASTVKHRNLPCQTYHPSQNNSNLSAKLTKPLLSPLRKQQRVRVVSIRVRPQQQELCILKNTLKTLAVDELLRTGIVSQHFYQSKLIQQNGVGINNKFLIVVKSGVYFSEFGCSIDQATKKVPELWHTKLLFVLYPMSDFLAESQYKMIINNYPFLYIFCCILKYTIFVALTDVYLIRKQYKLDTKSSSKYLLLVRQVYRN